MRNTPNTITSIGIVMVWAKPNTSIELVKNTLWTICGIIAKIDSKNMLYDQCLRRSKPIDPKKPVETARPKIKKVHSGNSAYKACSLVDNSSIPNFETYIWPKKESIPILFHNRISVVTIQNHRGDLVSILREF